MQFEDVTYEVHKIKLPNYSCSVALFLHSKLSGFNSFLPLVIPSSFIRVKNSSCVNNLYRSKYIIAEYR